MRGAGADGKIYDGSKRFQSVQAGVGIPLFRGAQKNTIAASRINIQLAENNYAAGLQQFKSEYERSVGNYNKNLQTVLYYENTALKNAETIIRTADIQFRNGEINYLEWVLLVNNAITIQNQYIDATNRLAQAIITVNSFITQ
jgi:cobalt-zinc-cadmium resistance protein CzcA